MAENAAVERIQQAQADIEAVAREFADAAEAAAQTSLRQAVDHFVAEHSERVSHLDEGNQKAIHEALDAAIQSGAHDVGEHLRKPDLWLHPTVVLDMADEFVDTSWSVFGTEHRRHHHPGPEPRLDHPNNRVWMAMTNAADPFDPVLQEYGFPKGDQDPGGGHYGLQPQTAHTFDESGTLEKLWKRYLKAYEGWTDALSGSKAERKSGFLARWRADR
jgi:hypothetical protein